MDAGNLASLNDPLLRTLICERDPSARETEIGRLIVTMTQPLAERVLSRYTSERMVQMYDVEDIIATVNLRVVRKLRLVVESEEEAVRDLADYVATLTYNAIHDHVRRRYPERTRLKNRLRYVLTHDQRLAQWTVGNALVAGIASWKGSTEILSVAPFDRHSATDAMLDDAHPANALVQILRAAGKPLTFETLLAMTTDLWEIADAPAVAVDIADRGDSAVMRLEQRDFLRVLWREIRLLPAPQRKALLLNLRDNETVNPLALVTLTGIAAFDEIATTMDMSSEELAAIWNDLPLDDLRIANLLGISRQQVINLRKSARQRLGRRCFRQKE